MIPRHRLVTIGDSLTQGVRSGAAVDGTLSWPKFVADAMGIDDFRMPIIATPDRGLPINLEHLAYEVLKPFGDDLGWRELFPATQRVRSWMDDVEDYWERGTRTSLPSDAGMALYHNLGILGFDLRDALSLTQGECEARIPPRQANDALIKQIPDHAGLRIARQVLSGAGREKTVFDAARDLRDDGGVEVLVVMLGSNNALRVASELNFSISGPGFDDLHAKSQYTLWRPEHFESEYRKVVDEVESIGATHTILATVPKVTVAPIALGVGEEKFTDDRNYYEYYSRIWVDPDDFDPDRDAHIRHDHARAADQASKAYSRTIRRFAEEKNWHVFDLDRLLDGMTSKRFLDDDEAQRPEGFEKYVWPAPLDQLEPELRTTFFQSKDGVRTDGGIFSLDGIHPTVIGSGVVAHGMAKLLASIGVEIGDVDLGKILALDELNQNPPDIVASAIDMIGWFDQLVDGIGTIGRLGR